MVVWVVASVSVLLSVAAALLSWRIVRQLVVVAIVGDTRIRWGRRWLVRLVVALIGAAVGTLPWLYANANSGFSSLRTGAFQVPLGHPPTAVG